MGPDPFFCKEILMEPFIHSVVAQDVDPTAQRVWTWDLPVNPLSHIFVTLKTTHTQATLADVASFADEIRVRLCSRCPGMMRTLVVCWSVGLRPGGLTNTELRLRNGPGLC